MLNTISVEFLKLRRSRALLLSIIANFIPALIRWLQYTFGSVSGEVRWERFLSSGQEIMVLCMLISVILVSCFVFSMEYQYNTASYIFTSGSPRVSIFLSKLVSLLVIIAILFIVSFISQLFFGILTIKAGIPGPVFLKLLEVTAWYIFSYFLLSAVIAMVVVLTKKIVISSVIVFGYFMLVFPFHLKNNPYICPFMTPVVVAAKMYGSTDYYFSGYYIDSPVNIAGMAVFIVVLAIISLTIGITCYKKLDAVK